MKKFQNCTPHAINLVNGDLMVTYPVSGVCPRVEESFIPIDQCDGVMIVESATGEVVGLPDPQEGVLLIVSRMVAVAAHTRQDLVSPGEIVRDAQGRIVGCKNFVAGPGLARKIDLQASQEAEMEYVEDALDEM